ncbi:FG-GAP-like repeat-containing protein [Streptomyces sp. MNU89]|uniref:FG-GAP-like repeat-containing protein n=1 Tax=Streptomyces sp. MNU89 TaxID=2560025 RepID=UPI0035A94E01
MRTLKRGLPGDPRRRRGVISSALALALCAPLFAVLPAAAAEEQEPAVERSLTEEAQALEQASDTGEPAEVLSLRTETSQVFANPSGTFTQDSYALPQWVRKGGRLVGVDTTLHENEDGTYSPKATEVGVRFSGGGGGPLVTVMRDGRSMAWSWPHDLPEPVVEDDTVTYRDVLTDVDLKLKAGSAGFGQLLVVKTAEAAADPALDRIDFGLATEGLSAEADDHGNLTASNPAGQEIFTAPTPLMWDSTTTEQVSASGTASLRTAASAPPVDEFEVPHGARDAALGLRINDDTLSLTPNQSVLRGEETQYPVYIDPSVSGSRYAWTIAYKKYPSTSYYNGNGWKNSNGSYGTTTARAGYENHTNGLARSYFRMNTKNLWSTDKVVSKSTFRIKNTWSWSCTAKPIELWRTAAIGSSTTWNNRPTRREKMATVTDAKGWSSSCPAGNLAFNVTQAAKDAAASHWNTVTFELAASNESDVYGWKKFDAKSAVFSTEYNTRPGAPTGLDTSPSTRNDEGCGDTPPHGLIGNTDIYLKAKATDKDGGTVNIKFHLWATGHHPNSDPNGVLIVDKTVAVTSGTVAKLKVTKGTLSPHIATASGNFSWKAQASDGKLSSDWTPTLGAPGCRFVFDPDRPSTPPGVTSTQFPDGSDGWPSVTGSVRTEGSFTLSSGGVADVAKYEYWTDSEPAVRSASPGTAGGSVTVKITPSSAGANVLYARSLDKVGNRSDQVGYLFYANGLAEADKPGDINGDGNPDLWAVDKDGDLHRYYGAGDGSVTDNAKTASNILWNDTEITHRGDWTGDGYEDLIALSREADGTSRLWLHPNNGYGFACTNCAGEDSDRRELTVYEDGNDHWQNADQILAIGDVDGPLDIDGDGTADQPGYPDLLVKEGDWVWLYFGAPDTRLDSDREPVLLASEAWAEQDLIAPGDTDGDGRVDLATRDRATGDLFIHQGADEYGDWLTDESNKIQAGTSFTVAANPLITSPGDADHSGGFDLWYTRSSTNILVAYLDPGTDHKRKVELAGDWTGYQAIS